MYGVEFRPLDFKSVLGLDAIKEILKNICQTEIYDPGYLFEGSYSSGKTTLARIFARSILCDHIKEDGSPCNECSSCKQFIQGRHPGYTEIDATNCGKDDIRDIKESLQYESVTQKRIILFDESHGISKEGKDALLKQLEKGDPNVILLFSTTEGDKMPRQLRSRLIWFQLPDPSEQDVLNKLEYICKEKNLTYDKDALYNIIYATGRHYRDAENRLRQVSLLGDISVENVKKTVMLYIDEVAGMLLTLPYDLSQSLKIADYLASRMSISSIYENILRIINDTIKHTNGFIFESERYNKLLKALRKQFKNEAFELLTYIVSKNKFSNMTFFISDMLILHYRFVRDSFKDKIPLNEKEEGETKKPSNEKTRDLKELQGIEDLPPHKKEDLIRKFKMEQRKKQVDDRVVERVSKEWGPDKVQQVPDKIHRKGVSREEFLKIVGGSFGESQT